MPAAPASPSFAAPLSRPACSGLTLAVLLAHGLVGLALSAWVSRPVLPPAVLEAVFLAPPTVPAAAARAEPRPPAPTPRPSARPAPRQPVPLATPTAAPLAAQDSVPPPPPPQPDTAISPAPTPTAASPASTGPVVAEAPPRPAAPPAPPAEPAPLPPGALRYRQPPAPVYPLLSRREQERGTVMLRILVDALGRPREWRVETSSGHPRLDAAALAAAAQTLFEPPAQAPARGVWVLAPIDFVLGR